LGNFLQVQQADILKSDQQDFEAFVSNTLNEFAARLAGGDMDILAVTRVFYLDPQKLTGFPAFTICRLTGAAVNEEQIARFRAAVTVLVSELVAQESLFHEGDTQLLLEDDQKHLLAECEKFLVKHSGQKITNGFSVHTGIDDIVGLSVNGQLRYAADSESVTEIIEGTAWTNGYCETTNAVFLITEDVETGKAVSLRFQCKHAEAYDLLARAKLNRQRVVYRGYRIKSATGRKEQLCLDVLELETEADEEKIFQLEP
jgi:hypothetical protein